MHLLGPKIKKKTNFVFAGFKSGSYVKWSASFVVHGIYIESRIHKKLHCIQTWIYFIIHVVFNDLM